MRLRNQESGFTLIELMISVAIAGAAVGLMYGMFVGTQRASKGQQDAVEMLDNGRIAMDLIAKDLRNTGFLVPSVNSVRIEDDCGNANNKLLYNSAAFTWTIGASASGTLSVSAGDFPAFIAAPSGSKGKCPNGSDRLTVISKPDIITANTCNAFGCIQSNSGSGTNLRMPCDGATPIGTDGNCQTTLDKALPNQGLFCSGNTLVTPPSTIYMPTCQADDPTACAVLPVTSFRCNDNSCPIVGSGGKLNCILFNLASFSGSAWNFDGGSKAGLDANGINFRSWQIMDYDGDGTTELVYSDLTEAAMLQPAPPAPGIDPKWVVVANDIDDLQFAWQPSSTATFSQTSLFDLPGCKTSTSNPANTIGNCLSEVYTGGAFVGATLGPTALAAVRVSLIARSERRTLGSTVGTDSFEKYGRAALENNNPAIQPYAPASAGTYGCTAANYEVCSGNGNAEGFKRRVLTETVGLRNTVGFAF